MLEQLPNTVLPVPRQLAEATLRTLIGARIALQAAEAIWLERLDLADGDPDLEETDLEDSFALSRIAIAGADIGPGCTVADTGEDDDPAEEDDPGGGNVTDGPHDPDEGI